MTRLVGASLVAAGLLAACGMTGSSTSAAAHDAAPAAAPPPAFVVAAAKREAAALGDPHPTSARYVLTRHRAAVAASSGATVTADQPVYLIVLTGHFRVGPVGPYPGRIVTGDYATETLDAATGRDTDFGVGHQRVVIARLGAAGDLLPYLRGTAHPVCAAPDVRAVASFQGATQSELGGITVTSRAAVACRLPAKSVVSLSWRGHRLSVPTVAFPAGWLARMGPRRRRHVRMLAPHARAQVILQWLNWCGPTPWAGTRGARLTVALRAPHQPAPIRATTAERVVPPPCNSAAGSSLRVSSFVGA